MHRFLRLFPAFRAIEQERAELRDTVQQLAQEKLRLEDRLDGVVQDRQRLWDLVQETLRGERTAYQMHINMSLQRQGAGVPYPDAPHLPPNSVPKDGTEPIGRRGRILPSEAVHRATMQVINDMFRVAPEP